MQGTESSGRARDGGQPSRRTLLAALGVSGTGLLAGCAGTPDDTTDTDTTTTQTTQRHTETQTTDQSSTETTSQEEQLLEETHSAEELGQVVQRLDTASVALTFEPANENADYANSVVFDDYSGELSVELDLTQAEQQRHHNQQARQAPPVQEFIQSIQDTEWRTQILREAEIENPEDRISWETYSDDSLSYQERMTESGMVNFWYAFEDERFGGISSANNHYKATALQELETQLGFDTFIWDHNIPGHGLVGAIENPTRSEENTGDQETYIVETDYTDRQQVVPWSESQYQHTELHPAREGVNRMKIDFYANTAIGKHDAEIYESTDVPMSGAEQFIEFFRNPESSPAYDHLDPMTAAAYIAEENIVNGNLDGTVSLGSNWMRLSG